MTASFYSEGVRPYDLLLAVGIAAAVAGLRRLHVTSPPVYLLAAIALWIVIFRSGVHATMAGVLMGLLTPARPLQDDLTAESVVDALENRAELSAEDVRATRRSSSASRSASSSGSAGASPRSGGSRPQARLATLPPVVSWRQFAAVGMLGGIGFTVSLSITGLAFTDEDLAEPAKVGILLASVVAATAGSAMFAALARKGSG